MTAAEAARRYGVPKNTITKRMRALGIDAETAAKMPRVSTAERMRRVRAAASPFHFGVTDKTEES